MNFFSKLFSEKYKLEKEREKLIFKSNKMVKKREKEKKRIIKRKRNIEKESEKIILTEINNDIKKLDIKLAFYLLQPHLTNDEISILQQYL